ncbi:MULTISPECIES: GerMN domain-containing protein [Brevibacillus]|uniref:GerMN domain-containing protein n=1 Tax=Brevibacillus laterosporus TaxID=1465 RepID=A0AAP3DJI4_BRELA|nr:MULTISPECIES: GerMN domain-containing protein [Brevibacillus]MBG9788924.1 spore gernimation protein [Brevibacillus laterosporus]MCG7316087.1 GerMN domain-containing protein [Brevibacillus laterosporus]MCR8982104.1 GerMN domain-containing protein [Brevibacillus laterosporus]MCZ0809258.1 GerMN domain-containing protein [Brevibacillus laterosporus]MCZ0827648.1 GerMN domain-containing protein [Brevibacillus laterosporus]
MKKRPIGKMTAVVGLSAILMTGCGLFGPSKETSAPIQAPSITGVDPNPLQITEDQTGEETQGVVTQTTKRTVYLQDTNGFVVPVSLILPKAEGPAKQVLSYMVKGGPVETLKPQGFEALLPEGTKILGMSIKEGKATIEFSSEFKNYKATDEQKILDAITRSMTEFDTVKDIAIWVNGQALNEMPANGTPISLLNRQKGINTELVEGAHPGRTSAVTVYFQSQLDDKRTYFVPVTRLIPETQDMSKAAVEELIKGPKEGSPLFSSLLRTTKVLGVEQQKDTVVVNLSNDVLKYDKGKEANPEAMESLVLSLTENTGIKKVQVQVEGKPLAQAGSMKFDQPVSRPIQINAFEL